VGRTGSLHGGGQRSSQCSRSRSSTQCSRSRRSTNGPATGTSPSLLQDVDFSWFPLNNPGLVSIPLSFFLGWLGTVLSKERPDEEKWAELEVRAFTGIGAEKAVEH